MLKSFLYAVLKVHIYIRSDWYEPVTFFVYIENCISYYTKSSGRIAEVRSRSMSCNCMTRTSQQECRGILEYVEGNIIKNIKEENLAKIMGPIYYR